LFLFLDSIDSSTTEKALIIDKTSTTENVFITYLYINPSSVYHGVILVSFEFNEQNYYLWSQNMMRALLSKNKLKFVDGSIDTLEPDDHQFKAWERSNIIILSWINHTLYTQITKSIVYIDVAKNLWDDLRERFLKGNHFRVSNLFKEIISIKQSDMSVTQLYMDLNILWEELESLKALPRCVCATSCKCNMSRVSVRYKESKYLMCFLKGLNLS